MKFMELSRMFGEIAAPLLPSSSGPPPGLAGLSGSALAWVTSLMARDSDKPLVLVAPAAGEAEALFRELLFFLQDAPTLPDLLHFPAWEVLPFEPLSPFGPLVAERIATLFRLAQMSREGPIRSEDAQGHNRAVVVTTPNALMQRLPPREMLTRHGFSVAVGDQLNLTAFRSYLVEAGYQAVSQVSEPGEFAVRGGILDFYPPGHEEAVRIELFGDEVETLRIFDPVTQRSTDEIPRVGVLPMREVILNAETITRFRTNYRRRFGGLAVEDELYRAVSQGLPHQGMEHFLPLFHERMETLCDYLPAGARFVLCPGFGDMVLERDREIREQQALAVEQGRRCLDPEDFHLSPQALQSAFGAFPPLIIHKEPRAGLLNFGFQEVPAFHLLRQPARNTVMDLVANFLKEAWQQGLRVCFTVRTVGQKERLRELLEDKRLPVKDVPNWDRVLQGSPGVAHLAVGDLGGGFLHPGLRLALITEEAVFGTRVRRRHLDQRYLDQLIAGFADLKDGDLVVHADHGIGRYAGLTTLSVGEIKNDFLLVRYADDDKLYVPVENLDRVGKYSGADGAVLDKLGAGKWEKTREKARKKILEMAGELVRLQALREATPGFAFSGPDALYQEFAAAFPFEETPDQAAAIQQVLEDMASPRPMDRLVCGDVGFGKTEVALRATFRAVMDGKQVAILVPTTILAQQHFETFSRRLKPYPVRVGLLSRFRSPLEQKQVVDALASGTADVVIGTHRLLQGDVRFRDLGLLVIDEEQRFGVKHKEQLKSMRAMVDILTLTATPIPRTLNMAMAGVRDISIIASPPTNRLAIRTVVTRFDRQKIREAILREIYRGGQVFYLYNRVEDIEKTVNMISELVPEAKVGMAHGQMREGRLERIMMSFYRQEFNVLVCTTIIENGVDIPSANTIIINRADKFGLGQLHQLRGRVGRSRHRAYAYLIVPHAKVLTVDAQKRLEALEGLGDLGAGFMLATHDLEIRGAGNILGDEQSGEIREVGYELYNSMLKEAVRNYKNRHSGQMEPEVIVPVINVHLSTYIPDTYVPDVHQRLSLYKRIAQLVDPVEIDEMKVELGDRFGPVPPSVDNLLRVLGIKRLCHALRVTKVEAGPKGGLIQFHPQPNVDPSAVMNLLKNGNGQILFNQDNRTMSLRNRPWDDSTVRLREIGRVLEGLLPPAEARG
ncbi:MAG: transcription-repair coupling factor [Magnetococcales bacterium]|nr:transcription-repair coupling factor [Magnetococcales bacterium]